MQTVDEVLSFRSLSDAQLSADGKWIAFVVDAALVGEHAQPEGSRIWLVDTEGGTPRQWTEGPGHDRMPIWSPDGRTLAFRSDRASVGVYRLFLLSLDGGEARVMHTPPGNVKKCAWSPDGGTIALLIAEGPGPDTNDAMLPIIVDDRAAYDRICLVDVASGVVTQFADPPHVWDMAWAGDASLVAVISDEPTAAAWYYSRLCRVNLTTGVFTTLYEPPPGWQVARPTPSPDGSTVAFVTCSWSDPGHTGGDLCTLAITDRDARPVNLTPGVEFGVTDVAWEPDGKRLIFSAYHGNQTSIGAAQPDGSEHWRTLWRGIDVVGNKGLRVVPGDGDEVAFATVREHARDPGNIWYGRIDRETMAWRQVTAFRGPDNPASTATFEDIYWSAADGMEIGGLLMRPSGMATPVPLVVIVHGGPTNISLGRFPSRGLPALAPLLAARGIATLLPNYRGSAGRGVAFAAANHGDVGGKEWADVIAGVDHLIASGIVDADRLGIGGWSYGGYMTMWAVTQTDRFKAGVAGAGVANWVSFHGGTSLHNFDRILIDGDPYDAEGLYVQRSPIVHMGNVETPTLLLHGDMDRDVAPDQSRDFYRALRDRGVETQYVLYPGAAHGPHHPRHIRDVIERSLAWFMDRL
jgi:dipeptidyl aminopeptidase/acylaminoacyl peptidase